MRPVVDQNMAKSFLIMTDGHTASFRFILSVPENGRPEIASARNFSYSDMHARIPRMIESVVSGLRDRIAFGESQQIATESLVKKEEFLSK